MPVTVPRCQLRGKAGAEEVEDAGLDEAVRTNFLDFSFLKFVNRVSFYRSPTLFCRRWARGYQSRRDGLLQLWSKGAFGQVSWSLFCVGVWANVDSQTERL